MQFGVAMTVISMFLKIFLAAGIALLANVTFNFVESIMYRSIASSRSPIYRDKPILLFSHLFSFPAILLFSTYFS